MVNPITDYAILTLNRREDELKRPDGSTRSDVVYVILDTKTGHIFPNRFNWDSEGYESAQAIMELIASGDYSVVE